MSFKFLVSVLSMAISKELSNFVSMTVPCTNFNTFSSYFSDNSCSFLCSVNFFEII